MNHEYWNDNSDPVCSICSPAFSWLSDFREHCDLFDRDGDIFSVLGSDHLHYYAKDE